MTAVLLVSNSVGPVKCSDGLTEFALKYFIVLLAHCKGPQGGGTQILKVYRSSWTESSFSLDSNFHGYRQHIPNLVYDAGSACEKFNRCTVWGGSG